MCNEFKNNFMTLKLTLTASLCRLQNEHFSSIDQSVSSSGSQSLKEGETFMKYTNFIKTNKITTFYSNGKRKSEKAKHKNHKH